MEGLQSMLPISRLEVKARRQKCRAAAAPRDRITGRFYADPAKALVMACIGRLVSDGYAEWYFLENGDVELRFSAGEVFLLADTTITRVT